MSIEITGPEKYEFQYNVCAMIAILMVKRDEATLLIEPEDLEDALLTFIEQGKPYQLEIQVKGSEKPITPGRLAAWLAHYPSWKTTDSLLARVASDKSRSILFVASGRCNDDINSFNVKISNFISSINEMRASSSSESVIRRALLAYGNLNVSKKSTLTKLRHKNIEFETTKTNPLELRDTLNRIQILEQLDLEEVINHAKEALTSEHQVVPDKLDSIYDQIKKVITQEKRTGKNVLPIIAKIINSGRMEDPLAGKSYVTRQEEVELLDIVSSNNALLITGAPRVGKSFCARSILASLQKKGYHVRTCGALEAERFLDEPVSQLRAAFVDDPLGGAHAIENATTHLNCIERIIPKLGNGRKLIVAQAQDRLFEVTRFSTLEDITTSGLQWTSLAIGEIRFLLQIWEKSVSYFKVPLWLDDKVSDAIKNEIIDLEPGCLVHLATSHMKLQANQGLDDIIRLARENSKDLGSALRHEKLSPVLSALAISSTQDQQVPEIELAFVLDNNREERPGISNVIGKIYNLGSTLIDEETNRPFPNYDSPLPKLTDDVEDSLESLEIRRLIVNNTQKFTFSHQFYRAAAESLIDAATSRSLSTAISYLERAIFSVSPDVSRAASNNLDWIFGNLNSTEGRKKVIEIALKGLKSIFPAVRDICFQFLVRKISYIALETDRDISRWVSNVNFFDLKDIDWFGDQPFIPESSIGGALNSQFKFFTRTEFSEVKLTLNLLNSDNARLISNEATSEAVQYLRENPKVMTKQMVARLLSSDISLIRAPAVEAWLSCARNDDSLILERIFNEEHPAVVESAYLGLIKGWPDCDIERCSMLTSLLKKMASSPASSVVLINELVLIDRYEHGGEITPWDIFENVFPTVMNNIPALASFSDARLYNVMQEALGNISAAALLEIITGWIGIVERIATTRVPSDYMLGVTEILISGVSTDIAERSEIIGRLLALPGTPCRIRVVADLVNQWDKLSSAERVLLLNHLKEINADQIWIHAAALTREEVPLEIQEITFPNGLSLSDIPTVLLKNLQADLIDACIHIHTGVHDEVYGIGIHTEGAEIWSNITRHIVRMPEHNMFENCWESVIRRDPETLPGIVSTLGANQAERIASLLFIRKQRTSGEFLPHVWKALFDLPVSEELKKSWIKQMVDLTPSAVDSFKEAMEWIPKSHRKEFLEHFASDKTMSDLILSLSRLQIPSLDQNGAHDLKEKTVFLIQTLFEDSPPKLKCTHSGIVRFIESLELQQHSFYQDLINNYQPKFEWRNNINSVEHPSLKGWLK